MLSVTDEERAKLEVETTPTPSSVEYYERRSVPISIPTTEKKTDESGKEYTVSCVYGEWMCSELRMCYCYVHRYSMFIWLAN